MQVEQEQKVNLTEKEQALLDGLEILNHPEIVINPFSMEKVMLSPKAVALYDFIKGCEVLRLINDFDMARCLFRKLFPESYMILLD